MEQHNPTRVTQPAPDKDKTDWWGLFHLHAFMSLTLADRRIEKRELVWIKRFFLDNNHPEYIEQLEELVSCGCYDKNNFVEIANQAAAQMATSEKRRFVYNLAQMVKSKGSMAQEEYENILEIAEQIGIKDTDADSIISSVFQVNDSFLAIIGLLALGIIMYTASVVIVPLVFAVFITMIVNRVERFLTRVLSLGRVRWLSQTAAMVIILSVVFGFVMATISSGQQMSLRLPFYETKFDQTLVQLRQAAQEYGLDIFQGDGLIEYVKQLPIGRTVSSFVSSLVSLLGNFLLVVIFTGFLVFSGMNYAGLLEEMNEKVGAYVSIKSFVSLLTGLGVYLLCLLFDVDFPLFWAILAFSLNFIPSVGAIFASIPPIILCGIQFESWGLALEFAVILTAMHVSLGQVLEPKMMGDTLSIKPLAIMLGLIFWGFLWGIPGMFLATPLMALVRTLASHFNFSRGFERLLAADRGRIAS